MNNPIRYIDKDGRIPWDQTVEKYKRIGSGFGENRGTNPKTGDPIIHRGQDLPANEGVGVKSFASGKVAKVGTNDSWGNYVVIDHGGGYYSIYAHMQDGSIVVKEKQKIGDGQQLGGVGNTGRSFGNHLHFEVGQAGSIDEFLSKNNRDKTRTDPKKIGDLEVFLHGQKKEKDTNIEGSKPESYKADRDNTRTEQSKPNNDIYSRISSWLQQNPNIIITIR